MVNVQDYLQTRDEYIRLLKTELLGPGSEITIPDAEHELITNPPDVRYSVGILFPRNNKLNADNDDSARVEESSEESDEIDSESDDREERTEALNDIDSLAEEDNLDEEIGLAAQNMPSSFGITFLASGKTEKIQCHIKFATYRHALVPDCRIPFSVEDPENFVVPQQFKVFASFDKEEGSLKLSTNITRKDVALLKEEDNSDEIDSSVYNAMYKLADQLRGGFVRIPHEVNTIIDFAGAEYVDNNRELDGTKAKLTALRREVSPGIYSVTVMMVNDDEKKSTATRCIFQPELIINSAENGFVFREFSALTDFNRLNEEEKSLELQYRNKKVFASGLGTSVCWKINEAGNGTVRNDFFPESEVPMMDFSIPRKYDLQKSALSMRFLSDLDKTSKQTKIDGLNSLVSAYGKWIVELDDKTAELEEKYKETANRNIQGCRNACDRMQSGVKTLLNHDNAWAAFELANRAMFMQRVHLKLQEKMSSVDRFPGDEEVSDFLENVDYREQTGLTQDLYIWRPFQLAFLLMSIDSIVNEKCKDRDIVDLIWFPTGGGKTEAYLGLTAFTIFFRRLSHAGNADGTAVIMRYTLRLLAAQQFTRASTLICACEFIRQDATSRRPVYGKYPLGSEEIIVNDLNKFTLT